VFKVVADTVNYELTDYGSQQAISRSTEVIEKNKRDELAKIVSFRIQLLMKIQPFLVDIHLHRTLEME
jgi:hypothetical protein